MSDQEQNYKRITPQRHAGADESSEEDFVEIEIDPGDVEGLIEQMDAVIGNGERALENYEARQEDERKAAEKRQEAARKAAAEQQRRRDAEQRARDARRREMIVDETQSNERRCGCG